MGAVVSCLNGAAARLEENPEEGRRERQLRAVSRGTPGLWLRSEAGAQPPAFFRNLSPVLDFFADDIRGRARSLAVSPGSMPEEVIEQALAVFQIGPEPGAFDAARLSAAVANCRGARDLFLLTNLGLYQLVDFTRPLPVPGAPEATIPLTNLIAIHARAARPTDDEFKLLGESFDTLRLLAGVDLSAPAPASGNTPLHDAVMAGNGLAVGSLILAGARLDVPDREGFTPLGRAVERGKSEIALLLQQSGAKRHRFPPPPAPQSTAQWAAQRVAQRDRAA